MAAVPRSGRASDDGVAHLATEAVPTGCLEVSTTASDTLRASVRVEGALSGRAVPMLLSILGTHVRSGRRYLRVDLRAATVADDVLQPLLAAQASLAELGGLLVLHADARLGDELRGAGLNVSTHA